MNTPEPEPESTPPDLEPPPEAADPEPPWLPPPAAQPKRAGTWSWATIQLAVIWLVLIPAGWAFGAPPAVQLSLIAIGAVATLRLRKSEPDAGRSCLVAVGIGLLVFLAFIAYAWYECRYRP